MYKNAHSENPGSWYRASIFFGHQVSKHQFIKTMKQGLPQVGKMRISCPGFTVGSATTYQWRNRVMPYHAAGVDDDDSVVDEASAYAEGSGVGSQAGACNIVDDPRGSIDDPGGGITYDLVYFSALAISTSTSPKSPASFVSSSLMTGISSLSLSGKSTVDVVGNMDVDCAAELFLFFARHPATYIAGRLWCDGAGFDVCWYDRSYDSQIGGD